VEESKPAADAEPKPAAANPEATPLPAQAAEATVEVKRGDTLGAIARQHLPPGITLNQMLIALYRANPDAFIRENVNLVRAGRILSIPSGESLGTVDFEEANRLVRAHHAEFNEYRARLAAAPVEADAASGARAVAGQIEAKPEAPAPEAPQDQLRLSKADPGKPAAGGAAGAAGRAAQDDDSTARERALAEAQSRVTELEKNVADLQKLLEMKNQQLAELESKAKPEPVTPQAAKPAAIPQAAPVPATKAEPAQPKAEPAKPKAEPAKPKPEPAKSKAAPPAASLFDELREDPRVLAGVGALVLVLLGYAIISRRKSKKAGQANFQHGVFNGDGDAPDAPPASQASASPPLSGMGGEEVDPLAEADVYMAYGRDAQAEEILKEALHKDAKRIPVHIKLLEIYANRKDSRSFEETALRLKSLTGGAGADWDHAAALGRALDPGNGLYGGGPTRSVPSAAPAAAAAPVAPAAAIDFDLGGSTANIRLPDISLDDKKDEPSASTVDFDLGAGGAPEGDRLTSDFTPEGTLIMDKSDPEKTVGGLDFDLDMGADDKTQAPPPPAPAAETSGGLDFDLNLDMDGGEKSAQPEKPAAPAPAMDLSDISLDLGGGEPSAADASSDPKWQEVATKLDLAKAYEEMGDKDGARELLGEVMKDGDAAQKGQAEQLLTKLA
jgi:pilus assembly protein FimV